MFNTPFHCETSPKRVGIRTNNRPVKTMVMCVKSIYASPLTNCWLEYKILRIYTAYYKKVMRETRGKFGEEESRAPEESIYTMFDGGKLTYDGDQIKEPTQR